MKITLKKPIKIILIILGVLLTLVLLLAIFISPIAHKVIEKHSKELCHRVVTMDDLTINLFKGSVDIEGFKALEENDKDVFATFDQLYVDISLFKLIGKKVQLNEITLKSPDIQVIQNGSRFNFTDIIEFYKKDDKPKDTTPSAWVVDLRNISISGGNIVYRDAQVKSKFDLRELAIAIPQIYFSTQKTDIGLDLKFANGGALNVKLLYSLKKSTYNLAVNLQKFSLSSVAPYVRQFLNVNDIDGTLTTKLDISGDTEHILDIIGKGKVAISNFSATDLENKKIADIKQLNVNIAEVDIKKNHYLLSDVTATGISTAYEIFKDSHSFDNIVKKSDSKDTVNQENNNSSAPIQFRINHVAIRDSKVTYADHTMRQTVSIPITNLSVTTDDFTLNGPLNVNIDATVGETGQLKAKWSGSLSDLKNQKINLFLTNFKIAMASPYCYEYLAYPLTEGVLSFMSNTTLTNNQLNSKNKIDIYNCVVGKKDKSFKPEFNIPLRAGVYVLTDRKGKMQLDIPVSGDLNSPNFSYKKIIFKAIGNLFVKVAAAPIDFLVKAIGGDPDIFADIEYEIHPQGLGSESYDKLNKIVDAMKQKPDLKITMQQSINLQENVQEYALYNAKREYYISLNGQNAGNNYEEILKIKNTDPKFIKYVDNRLGGNVQAEIKDKCVGLYDIKEMGAQIDRNLRNREQQILDQFTMQGISADRITFLPLGEKNTPKGKTLLSFGVNMEDDE